MLRSKIITQHRQSRPFLLWQAAQPITKFIIGNSCSITIQKCSIPNRRRSREQLLTQNSKLKTQHSLHFFPRKLHLKPKYCCEYHFNILPERVVAIVMTVQAHFIRIDHVIVIPHSNFLVTLHYQLSIFLI